MVDEVRTRPSRVVGVPDPHFLAEGGLHGDVDGNHDEDPRAEVEEYSEAAPISLVLIAQDEGRSCEVEHELHACAIRISETAGMRELWSITNRRGPR